jgi:hypothetical protein
LKSSRRRCLPDVEIIDPTTAVAEVTRAETAEVVVLAEPVAETAEDGSSSRNC